MSEVIDMPYANYDEQKKYQRLWCKKNTETNYEFKEKRRLNKIKYRESEENREKEKEYRKKYRFNNITKIRASNLKSSRKNRIKRLEAQRKYRERLKTLGIKIKKRSHPSDGQSKTYRIYSTEHERKICLSESRLRRVLLEIYKDERKAAFQNKQNN